MSSDVIDKKEQEKDSPILQDNESQTNLIATDVIDKQEQNNEVPNREYNKTETNVISADVTDIPSTTDMLSEEVTQHKAEDKADTGDNIDVQPMDTKGDMMPQDIPHQNNDDADQLCVNRIEDDQKQEDTKQPEDVDTDESNLEDKQNQTELDANNIVTVDRIEIAGEMVSWGTQTDVLELKSMTPILPSKASEEGDEGNLKTLEHDTDSESIPSSTSRIGQREKTSSGNQVPNAGLDMH